MIMRTMTTKMKRMKIMKQRLSLADTIYPCELPYCRRHYTDPSHCLPPPHQNSDDVSTWDGWMDGWMDWASPGKGRCQVPYGANNAVVIHPNGRTPKVESHDTRSYYKDNEMH